MQTIADALNILDERNMRRVKALIQIEIGEFFIAVIEPGLAREHLTQAHQTLSALGIEYASRQAADLLRDLDGY